MGNLLRGEKAAIAALKFDYSQIAEDCREDVQEAALDIKASEQRARDSLLTIGSRLTEVKAMLPHGQFEKWIEAEFDLTIRTAQNWMNVAQRFKNETFSFFSQSAAYLLAVPAVPDEAIGEAIELARAKGAPVTNKEAKEIAARHKPPRTATYSPPPATTPPPATSRPAITPQAGRAVYVEPAPVIDVEPEPPTMRQARQDLATQCDSLLYRLEAAIKAIDEAARLVDDHTNGEGAAGRVQVLIGKVKATKARGL